MPIILINAKKIFVVTSLKSPSGVSIVNCFADKGTNSTYSENLQNHIYLSIIQKRIIL
jgi:hypothetical protein